MHHFATTTREEEERKARGDGEAFLDTQRVMTSTVSSILIPDERIQLFDKYDHMYDFIDSTSSQKSLLDKI
jgi:hypothetical protein